MSQVKQDSADLHIHSIFSDSDDSLESIFTQAKEKGLKCIALTDHDTVDGIELARDLSKEYGIELIDGIEFSCQKEASEVHILGYFLDIENKEFKDRLQIIRKERYERMIIMIEKLKGLGLPLDRDEVLASVGKVIPTRLHLALSLIKKGEKGTLTEVFKRHLVPGCPAYVNCFNLSVKEAIGIIKNAGGVAFLAHPHILANKAWIEEFVNYGLDGMEVVYPNFDNAKIEYYKNMARKFSLLTSGGSDAHGSYKKFTSVGAVSIPYSWVERIKEQRKQTTNIS